MSILRRVWIPAATIALAGCFSESGDTDDDDDDDTTSASTSPTAPTSDPSISTSVDSSMDPTPPTTTLFTSSEATTESTLDTSATTDSDTDPDTTGGACPSDGPNDCGDGLAAIGEVCFLEPEPRVVGIDHIGDVLFADINGDMAPDVVHADGGEGAFVLFTSEGEVGLPTSALQFTAGWSVDVGRVAPDDGVAIVVGGAEAAVYIIVYEGAGFSADVPLSAPGTFVIARVADIDDDGDDDIVAGSDESANLMVHLNDSFGGFDMSIEINVGVAVGVADMRILRDARFTHPGIAILTVDGRLLLSPVSNAVPEGFGEIDPTQTYGVQTQAMLAVGDIDGDFDDDLAVAYDGRAFVFRADNSNFAFVADLGASATGNVATAIGDVNGDGLGDVLLAEPSPGDVVIYLGDENGGFAQDVIIDVPANPRGVAMGDVDGDCAVEIVAVGQMWFEVARSNP